VGQVFTFFQEKIQFPFSEATLLRLRMRDVGIFHAFNYLR